jgi:class 3 adenylate cyclase/tetratricopeptide (TPR) repeat protein
VTEQFSQRIGDLVADAQVAADRGEWGAARSLARAALSLDAQSARAHDLLRAADAASPEPGERRHLTVMFCDVVGSTGLAASNDPEVVGEVLRDYRAVSDEVVRRYGGHLAVYIGDGLLFYFGYPEAHEDDARRGVKAGLDLLSELGPVIERARQRHGVDLAVRIAVHTGLVVRTDMGAPSLPDRGAIVGETPNLAARLQDRAQPGTLVISASTYALVRGYFVVAPLGELELRGITEPTEAYEVIAEATATTRIEAQRVLSPFVGRDDELDALEASWAAAIEGPGRAVLITGEPGIGKSRLGDVFLRRVHDRGQTSVRTACSPYHTSTHFYAIRRLVERVAGIDTRDSPRVTLPVLRDALEAVGRESDLGLFASFLDIPAQPWCPAPELDGLALRQATLDALLDWLGQAVADGPVAVLMDDLQWADPSTLEVLSLALADPPPGLLVVLTARTGAAPSLGDAAVEQLEVNPLAEADLRHIANVSRQGRRLGDARLRNLIERSDGVPLFFEELLRWASDTTAAAGARPAAEIPASLRDPLLAGLSAAGVDLALAQTIATIGLEAEHGLLLAVTGFDDGTLRTQLGQLITAGVLDAEGEPPTYHFHHRLMGELAYETQLHGQRATRHSQVADVLLALAAAGIPRDSGAVTYHLERAGRAADAIEAIVAEVAPAQAQGAHAEAMDRLSHALKLLPSVEDEDARVDLELLVRQARGFSAVAAMGYAAPMAADDFLRCLELCRATELKAEHLSPLLQAWSYFCVHGDLDRTEEMCVTDLRQLAQLSPLAPPESISWGITLWFRGEYERAIEEMRSFLASSYAASPGIPPGWPLPNDPVATVHSHLAAALAMIGDPVGAVAELDAALARASSLPFPHGPFSVAYARSYEVLTGILLGDAMIVMNGVREEVAISERHGLHFWSVVGQLQMAFGAAAFGIEGAMDQAEAALAVYRAMGAEVLLGAFLTQRAGVRLAQGDADAAIAECIEAEAMAERTGSKCWLAETYRTRGEAMVAAGDPEGVQEIERAADLARAQSARVFELRAVTSLCNIVNDAATFDSLVDLVKTFDPDVGFADLDAARALLAGAR